MHYLGNLAANHLYSRLMECEKCQVSWGGCSAACECPQCGEAQEYWFQPLEKLDANSNHHDRPAGSR